MRGAILPWVIAFFISLLLGRAIGFVKSFIIMAFVQAAFFLLLASQDNGWVIMLTQGPSVFISILGLFIGASIQQKSKEQQVKQNIKIEQPITKAGHKGYCENCGVKVKLNYGNAYHTLCPKCA